MRLTLAIALLAAGLLLSGCGSSSKTTKTTSTTPKVLPRATTNQVWAERIVNFLLRPLNRDLVVVQNFDNPQVRIYIATRNATTLRIVRTRLNDLGGCTMQLQVIGPPAPGASAEYASVQSHLQKACAAYGDVATRLLKATDLLASTDKSDALKGADAITAAHDPSARAAKELSAAVKIAQRLAPFRRAGLRPSV